MRTFSSYDEAIRYLEKSQSPIALYRIAKKGRNPYYRVEKKVLTIQDFGMQHGDNIAFIGVYYPGKGLEENKEGLLRQWK